MTHASCRRNWTYCVAAVIAAALLFAPAHPQAQSRQLGPPTGADLEGGESEQPQPPQNQTEAPPQPPPKPRAAKPKAKPPKRFQEMAPGILDIPIAQIPDYRDTMRDILVELSQYARSRNPKFAILVRPGFDLLWWNAREYDLAEAKRDPTVSIPPESIRPLDMPMVRYQQSIDGFVVNGQLCSPLHVPKADLEVAYKEGLRALSLEHCASEAEMMRALQDAAAQNLITAAEVGDDPLFGIVPRHRPIPENPGNVESVSAAKNMLVLFSSKAYGSHADWLNALGNNNYDMLVIDAFDRRDEPLTKDELHSLKFKQLGARRLVLARLDVGFADDGRYYWQPDWQPGHPSWIIGMGPDYPGQYIVEFWNPAWKAVIGNYLASIIDLGFDGVMLDGVEAYRRWEAMTPVSLAK